ncbi:tetratricopeptide repeat protein [Rubinisphaera margarita]|uniref:tetratricopeptide repeat protein n=1 Tax=Rubinisphaera margarita TaxID=2909586 RepID=UPI001EE79D1B|nr:tetratricopeptide repeat protein [Rubinisphaera margarita]MCG6154843.1 tetratricopeptide repeat protein [Rubinisphaera margarita]
MSTIPTSRTFSPQMLWLLLAGVIGVVYGNSFAGVFVFDDTNSILDNPSIRSFDAFFATLSWDSLVRPGRWLAYLTLTANYAISELEPWSYHLVNLLIHLVNALLLFELVRMSTRRLQFPEEQAKLLAFCVALLWAVHPLQTQAVTYVIQRIEALASLFYLGVFFGFAKSQETSRKAWLVMSFVSFWCGLWTKQIIVTAPLLLLCYDRIFWAVSWKELWRKRGLFHAAMLLSAAWLVLLTFVRLGNDYAGNTAGPGTGIGSSSGVTPLQYALTQPGVVLFYLRLWFLPIGQNLDHFWQPATLPEEIVPPLIIILGLLAATGWALWKAPVVGFAGLWFFLILAPTSTIVPIRDLAVEHRVYLPSAALSVLCVAGLAWVMRRWKGAEDYSRALLLTCGGLAMVLGVMTHLRNDVYSSEYALWQDVVNKSPNNGRALTNLVEHYQLRGQVEQAEQMARRAVNSLPNSPETQNLLGSVLIDLGKTQEAEQHVRQSLKLNPLPEAYLNLALLVESQQPQEAIGCLQKALELRPDFARAHNQLGMLLLKTGGEIAAAEQHFRLAIEHNPGNDFACNNLAIVLAERGQTSQAIALLEQILRRNPSFDLARRSLIYVQSKLQSQ